MDLVFLGTPQMAVPTLVGLHEAGHRIVAVVTGEDRRRHRRGSPGPSPVKAAALDLGVDVSHDPNDVLDMSADLGVVVAYGRLIKRPVLDHLPMVNLHFSLLPRWRGAAPVERALLAGDSSTGVCLMALDEGLDTGCVYDRVEVPIDDEVTAAELREDLVRAGTRMLLERLNTGMGECIPQEDFGATYAAKLTPEDLRLNWGDPVEKLLRQVRVGGAWTEFRGERFKVHRAVPVQAEGLRTDGPVVSGGVVGLGRSVVVRGGDGFVRLLEVQPAGKTTMAAGDWANGANPFGSLLGRDTASER